MMDYSGMQLRYVDQQRTFDGGVLEVGHVVNEGMIVPPRSTSFSIFGVCNETCTASVSKIFQFVAIRTVTCGVYTGSVFSTKLYIVCGLCL